MEWLPTHLMHHSLPNCASLSQHVKQAIMIIAGIETKSQEEMNKGQREDFAYSEYMNWVEIVASKYPHAAINGWLEFTTGKRTQKVTGAYIYRNFQEGLRIFHNEFNKIWGRAISEGTSGKAKQETWQRFLYLLACEREQKEAEPTTPDDFNVKKFETKKWVLAYKHQGPPCEYLGVGAHTCHEFLANPKGLAMRSTGQKKRKSAGLSRSTHRELKARKTKQAVTEAYANRKTVNALDLGRTQSINNYLRQAEKVCVSVQIV